MDSDKLIRFARIEETLRKLLNAIQLSVPAQELQEATEKIDHDEFGIALQVIGALLVEHQVHLSPEEKQRMIALIEQMGMTDQDDEDYWFWEEMRPVLQSGG
jgi:hypothetical protein